MAQSEFTDLTMIPQTFLLSAVWDQSSVAMGILDQNATLIYLNCAYAKLHDAAIDDLVGKPLTFFFPSDLEQVTLETILPMSDRQDYTWTLQNTPGKFLNVEIAPLSQTPKFWLIELTPKALSDGKPIEAQLQESQDCHRIMTDNTQDLIARYSPQGICLYASGACEKLLGYTPQELLGTHVEDLFHPQDLQRLQKAGQRLLDPADIRILTYRMGHKQGHYLWFETTIGRLYDPQTHELQELITVSRDITERQDTQASFEQQTEKITKILDSISDALLTVDQQSHITYVNAQAQCLLFSEQHKILGQLLWDLLPEFWQKILKPECDQATLEQKARHLETFNPSLTRWLEVAIYPYTEGLSISIHDISERKQAEAVLLERSQLSSLAAEIGKTLGQGGDLPALLDRCTQILIEQLEAIGARIWTFDAESQMLELQALAGSITLTDPLQARIPLGISVIGFIATRQQAYCTNHTANDVCIGAPAWISDQQIQAFAGYPLILEERLLGVLAVLGRNPFSEDLYQMLAWISDAIALAIDRSWARTELISRREGLLFGLASQIRKSLDLNTILDTAVHEIRNLLQIDSCHFLWCILPMKDSLSIHLPILTITHEAQERDLPSLLGEYPITQVEEVVEKFQSLDIFRIDDTRINSDEHPYHQELLEKFGIMSELLVPLRTHTGQLGAIVCSQCHKSRVWTDSEVELLRAACDQLAIAIDQSELYTQTRAAAFHAQAQAQQLEQTLKKLKQTQAQLVQTEKMSGLGQMVAGIAHEINNPVNFINGNLLHASNYIEDLLRLLELYQRHYPEPNEDILDESEDIDIDFLREDLPKMLDSMKVGADRISQIVLSLRNFSRLDEAEMKPVQIDEGIDNTLLILQHRLKAKGSLGGINVLKNYGDLPQVECHASQLNQVFMNIISNSIDALENRAEPRQITIVTDRGKPKDWKTPHVAIRIQDNGQGMTEEVKRRLFDPFFTTKPVGKGTGLGLSISYQIVVEKHRGKIDCFSEPGKGSEFVIRIPIKPVG
ncbi:MAG: PAS domain S-box protein [Roseofilum sp. SBFL]|uniref:PAS domain S-box protein n=1 Tax=unclassified Roseofilum TaxID=2620099 RepID=UPI001B08815E|nr:MULTISPECIES: PAS domain S-box protein [unclassified Roseofilum]MBP0012494.1 PAS domain S-box protein [Roseofilum sp. SID3]MBP0024735.1 PAS domain S-box protein [Roseofilum sp. SID2]MBP0037597.1 PAS domain S-box protein [Roseofilum sp. SID1]MBP0041845.1 PAS domain S-box protein [Roseofilum sp. SBFL]